MINFNADKLRSVYVYIVKITTGYVYVTSHRNGHPYTPNGLSQSEYNDQIVTRIPISQTVYTLYRRYSLSTEFSRPRLAALNFYGDTIVSVESQQFSRRLGGFQNADAWKSYFAKAIGDLREKTENVEAFIDGVDIFWPTPEDGISTLDKDGCFNLIACQAVNVGNLGRPLTSKVTEKLENKISSSEEDDISSLASLMDNLYHLRNRKGILLQYRPECGLEGHTGDYTTVYSSVLADIPALGRSSASMGKSKEEAKGKKMIRALYEMCHDTTPSQANLNFLITSAKTVGKLYGMEHAGFLNVPRVMKATGQMCLVQIADSQRGMTPIGISAQEALGWLFRFIHMEDNLSNLRHLTKCMKSCLQNGLMPQSEDSLILESARGTSIPLASFDEFKQRPTLLDEPGLFENKLWGATTN
jgi:hypothetical protein